MFKNFRLVLFSLILWSFNSYADPYEDCVSYNIATFNGSAQVCASLTCANNGEYCAGHFVGPHEIFPDDSHRIFHDMRPCPGVNNLPYVAPIAELSNCSKHAGKYVAESFGNSTPHSQKKCGSIVSVEDQGLAEVIPIVGVPFSLIYSTNFSKGRLDNYKAVVPITTSSSDNDIQNLQLKILLGGNSLSVTSYPNYPNIKHTYIWNGKNSSNEEVQGYRELVFLIRESRANYYFEISSSIILGSFRSKLIGLGGWAPSILRYYDLVGQRLVSMDGTIQEITPFQAIGSEIYVAAPDGSEVYVFNSTTGYHLHTKTSLTGALKYSFNYNGNGLLSSISEPFSRVTTFDRDSSGNLTSITSPDGQITTIAVNINGYIQTVTNPKSESYSLSYVGAEGLLSSFEKPNGKVSTFTYDSNGKLIKDAHTGGYFFDLVKTIGTNGETIVNSSTVMGRNTTTSSVLGGNGDIERTVTYPDGTSSFYSYKYFPGNGVHQESNRVEDVYTYIEKTPDARFSDKVYIPTNEETQYGAYGRRTITTQHNYSLSNSSNPFSISSYSITRNLSGTPTSVVSTYNPSLKKWVNSSNLGKFLEIVHDSHERPLSFKTGNLNSISYSYTNEKLTSITQGSRVSNLTYHTSNGKVSSIVNPLMQTTLFGYDSANRLISQTLPDLRLISFSYDANGNLTGVTPSGRPSHSFTLNSRELLSGYFPPTLSGYSVVNTSYIYNDDKQLTQITFPSGNYISYIYHPTTGILESMGTPMGTYSFSYDSYGKLSSIGGPSGDLTSLSIIGNILFASGYSAISAYGYGNYSKVFDSYHRVSSDVVYEGAGQSEISYLYNNDEDLKKAGDLNITYSYPNGLISGTTLGSGTTGFTDSYTYNLYGETTDYLAKRGTSNLYNLSVVRDDLGRVSQKTEVFNSITNVFDYAYDNSGRLVQVNKNSTPVATYGYDSNSNRNSGSIGGTTTTATYDNQDRMLTYGVYDYTYSVDGYLTSKTNTLTSQTTSYVYDVFGNLLQVTLPSSDVISYEVDGLNRRISKAVNGNIVKKWVYMDQYRIAAELNGTGVMTKRFIYGSKGNIPDYMIAGGIKYRIISDHLGSPRLVVRQSNGSVIQRMNHDEFGRVTEDTNPGYLPFGFAGGLYDHQTGLVRFGARDYDPEVGRWTSKDPILFNGQMSNLYGYSFSDPVNFIDRNGREPATITAATAVVAGFVVGGITNTVMSYSNGIRAPKDLFASFLLGGAGGAAAGVGIVTGGVAAAIGIGSSFVLDISSQLLNNSSMFEINDFSNGIKRINNTPQPICN